LRGHLCDSSAFLFPLHGYGFYCVMIHSLFSVSHFVSTGYIVRKRYSHAPFLAK